jgi:hypothetical protein
MAQPKKNIKKPAPAAHKKTPHVYSGAKPKTSLLENLDSWFNNRASGIKILAFSLCILFSLLLFQARMDIGGDDSGYILRAYDFIHKGTFPSLQGPLYPIVLSIFISLFGIKIILLKFLSVIFVFFALFFLHKTFKDKLPPLVFYPVFLLTAINSYILQFASLTYSEAIFMFLQSVAIYYFFKLNDKLGSLEKFSIKETYKDFLVVGLFVFLMSLSRSVGLFALPALMLFFLVRMQFKAAGAFAASFAVFYALTEFIKRFIIHTHIEWGSERNILLLKDQYHPDQGYENMSGLVARFKGNMLLFLSKRFFQIIGLRSEDELTTNNFLAFVFIVLALFALYRAFKSKNNYVIIITLYVGVMLASTFLAVQTSIDQPRFIMVYVPLILLMFLFSFYEALKKAPWAGQSLVVWILAILMIASVSSLLGKAKDNIPVLGKNFKGDMTYGFTPDWVNYIKMSQWCSENLTDKDKVATRKAEVSFMYTNKEIFFPVYKVYSTDADSILDYFKKNNVNYVMLASLRGNPKVADGNIVTTLWRMLKPIADNTKYAQKLKLVHQEGTSEPAYLYEIVY